MFKAAVWTFLWVLGGSCALKGQIDTTTALTQAPSASYHVSSRLGGFDAITGKGSFSLPLGPTLPGRIPAGFSLNFDGTGLMGSFRPVTWRLGNSYQTPQAAYSNTVTLFGSDLVFHSLPSSLVPSATSLQTWMTARRVDTGEAAADARINEIRNSGAQIVSGPTKTFIQDAIQATTDGTKFLAWYHWRITYGLPNPKNPDVDERTVNQDMPMNCAVINGDQAVFQSENITYVTTLWGDKVSILETTAQDGLSASFTIRDEVVPSNSLTLSVNTSLPATGDQKFRSATLGVTATGALSGLPVAIASGFYLHPTSLPNWTGSTTWAGAFLPISHTSRAVDGTERTTTFQWNYSLVPGFSLVIEGISAGELGIRKMQHSDGLVEKFAGSGAPTYGNKCWNFAYGTWTGFKAGNSMSSIGPGFSGIDRIQTDGTGSSTRVSRIIPWGSFDASSTPHVWRWSSFDQKTLIYAFDRPTFSSGPSGLPYRLTRLTHVSLPGSDPSSSTAFLAYTSAVVQAESLYGTGVGSDWSPQGATTTSVIQYSGWDLSSWINPTNALLYPTTAVATRVQTFTPDLPTKTTLVGDLSKNGRDARGPVRTDESTDGPAGLPALKTGRETPAWNSPPSNPSLDGNVRRTGVVTREWRDSLAALKTLTDQKTLAGSALPNLRGVASADFGTTTYAYDALGRISSQKGDRGGFTAEEQRSYVDGLPLLRETTQNALTGPGGPYYPNPDNSGMVAGKVYTWADTHVQGGPSTVRDKIDGRTESFHYDDLGRETGHTDVLGITTTTSYDAWGRKSQVTRLARGGVGAVTTDYAYDVNGTWKDETLTADGRSLRTRTNLDAFGRAVKVTAYDANGIQATSQSFGYDGFGQKVRQSPVLTRTQASWGNETWAYDGQGRMTDHWDAQGRLLQHVTLQPTWTTIGGITAVWTTIQDDRGFTRSEAVDLLGQKRAVIDQAGQLSESFYDQDGHLIQTLQGNQQRSYTYNAMGWLTSRTEPEEGTTVYSKFTQAGAPLVVQQYGRSGGSVRNAFSTVLNDQLLPAIQSASGPEGSVVRTLTYDPATRLLTALQETQPNGTLTEAYGYDDLFRVSSKTVSDGAQSFNVNRAFDAAGRVTSLTYPAAAGRRDVVGYTYDVLGRMSAVTVNGETRPRGSMVYDQVSDTSVSQVLTYGNNAWTTSRADRGELAQVTHVAPAGTLEDHTMAWTPGGLLTRRGTDTFGYDALQRLSSAHVLNPQTGTYVDQGFSYDRYGNRTSSTTTAPAGTLPATSEALTWTAAYGSSNDLPATVAAVGGSLATGALYDDLGRMKQVWTTPGQAATQTAWTYDPSGRIVKENGTAYLLDGQGLRFRRSKGDGSITYTVYGFNREPLVVISNGMAPGEATLENGVTPSGGPSATTHGGGKAVRIWHKQGTNCSLDRYLGRFEAGDIVTATVWCRTDPGTTATLFLGDAGGPDPYDNQSVASLDGNGKWQCLTVSRTLSHADDLWIYIYGNVMGNDPANSTSVLYDDVTVTSTRKGVVLQDGFESGFGDWDSAGQPNDLLSSSTATTYTGHAAVRIWHKQGTNCSLARYLGKFDPGDIVTATVWCKTEPGTAATLFLGDAGGVDPYDNQMVIHLDGNGDWQRLTVHRTMSHADDIWIYIYGNVIGNDPANSTSVLYDDVRVTSTLKDVVFQDGFESGLGNWDSAGQPGDLLSSSTATTYSGHSAVRIWHRQGTNCSLDRYLGRFEAGDIVTATVWCKTEPGTAATLFVGDAGGADPYDNQAIQSLDGNGDWQRLTVNRTLSHADDMWIYIYGNVVGNDPSNSTSVLYDEVTVTSTRKGVVLQDGFESGFDNWDSAGQPNQLVSAVNTYWERSMVYGFGQLLSESRPDGVIYIQGDQVGSPNVITNASGVLVNRTKNLPFGERLIDGLPGAPKSLRRFTNHEEDPDSNAIYMQARTYLAGYGKFVQVDPAYDQTKDDPETWNLYNYVTNNPVTKTDPDGRIMSIPEQQQQAWNNFYSTRFGDALYAISNVSMVLRNTGRDSYTLSIDTDIQAIGRETIFTNFRKEAEGPSTNTKPAQRGAVDGSASKNALVAGTRDLSEKSIQALEKALGTGSTEKTWRGAIESAAEAKGIDPNLLVGLGFKESTLNPNAVNGEAKGMFQILPARQADLHLSTEDLFTPKVVAAVAGALSGAIKTFHGNTDLAIASWTLGAGRTQSVFAKEGMDGVRNRLLDARNPSYGRLGINYIDIIRSFQ
ncbi:RHS repeat-associated core domain-containing protein [Geothrix sp. 21YS21S-4]|uniref:RHS repeat-associated core domain-containing protein n=1 Tax=Geothrix sp. 21YS21S-4 TaxID=3068889 RepID=UPI0027B8E9B7|nr:RHS repeat-associated core domain-containing protein [Geothrix sp. 21YS21S-4]